MEKEKAARDWWLTHQKETIELMERFAEATTMMASADENGQIILQVGTMIGHPIKDFPTEVDGAKVVYVSAFPQPIGL